MNDFATFLSRHAGAITMWMGAICTFAIFSILYKENPLYRVFEHIFIGLAAGQGLYATWSEVLKPRWWDPMVLQGQWWWVLAIIPGVMFYFIYSQRHSWISRVIFGTFIGLGAGAVFQDFANNYTPMIRGSFKPIIPMGGIGWSDAVSNIIFVTVLITVMSYFFFSVDHTARAIRGTAQTGRWLLMFAFGAMFGASVMARLALFVGRMDFLLNQWAPSVSIWSWAVILILIVAAIVVSRMLRKPPTPGDRPEGSEPLDESPVPDATQP